MYYQPSFHLFQFTCFMLLLEILRLHRWLALVAHNILLLDGTILDLRSAGFSCNKGLCGKYFRFLGHSVSIAATPLCQYGKSSHANSGANKPGCHPVQLSLFTKTGGWLARPMGHSLTTALLGYQTFIQMEFGRTVTKDIL